MTVASSSVAEASFRLHASQKLGSSSSSKPPAHQQPLPHHGGHPGHPGHHLQHHQLQPPPAMASTSSGGGGGGGGVHAHADSPSRHDDSEESGVGHEEEDEMNQLLVELLSNIRTPRVRVW